MDSTIQRDPIYGTLKGNWNTLPVSWFNIDKKLQKGAMTGSVYKFATQNIIHSWVEVQYKRALE